MVYSTRRFVLCLASCFGIAITSLREERANLSAFRTFVRVALVWFCLFPPSLCVWEELRSWGLGKAAVCDCGTPRTFFLPFL